MSVVVDSSPLIFLAAISRFELLRLYFSEILIPSAVYQEVVLTGGQRPGAQETQQGIDSGWIRIAAPADEKEIGSLLQRGMTEADAHVVALARQVGASLVISDDPVVRDRTRSTRVPVTGVLGILLRGKLDGHISNVKNELSRLIQVGFHIDTEGSIYTEILRRAGEME